MRAVTHARSQPRSVTPARGESNCCRKSSPIPRRRMLWSTLNAPQLHVNLHETCTRRCVTKTPRHPTRQITSDGATSFSRMRESSLSESARNSSQKDAPAHPECTAVACKLARKMHSWRVAYTPRHPARQAISDGAASFPRTRESSCCRIAPAIHYRRMLWSPLNARELHSNLQETCIRGAVRRPDAPDKRARLVSLAQQPQRALAKMALTETQRHRVKSNLFPVSPRLREEPAFLPLDISKKVGLTGQTSWNPVGGARSTLRGGTVDAGER